MMTLKPDDVCRILDVPPCNCSTCFTSRGFRYPYPAGPLTREQADRLYWDPIRWNARQA